MKSKINKIVLIFLAFTLTAINVKAATASLTVDKEEVVVGETFRIAVNISSAAAWNVHVDTAGPVSNCKINEADTTEDATDTDKTFTVDCAATEVGTVTVSLTGDVTSVTNMNAVNVSGEKTITVTATSEETISSYTITFDGNGGNTCSPNTKTIISGQSVGTLCTPTRSGFTFNGWFTASNGGRKITSDSIIENDITLYAQWVKKVSNPKTGITSSAAVLLIIAIVSIVGYFEVKKKNINLE